MIAEPGSGRTPSPPANSTMALLSVRGLSKSFGGVRALSGRVARRRAGRGAGARGRERRRQVDAHPRPLRGARARRRAPCCSTARSCGTCRRSGRARWASRSSTSSRRCSPTCPSRRTWRWATSRRGSSAASTGRRGAGGRRRCWRGSVCRSTPTAPRARSPCPRSSSCEIARALGAEARVLVLDEPTASLSVTEVETLLALLRDLRAQGLAIVYVSHRLEEVFAIADRVTVLRDGAVVATHAAGDLDRASLIRLMVGRELAAESPRAAGSPGAPVLEAVRLGSRAAGVHDVSLTLRAGEIVGLFGLVNSGRTELARVLCGLTLRRRGRDPRRRHARDARLAPPGGGARNRARPRGPRGTRHRRAHVGGGQLHAVGAAAAAATRPARPRARGRARARLRRAAPGEDGLAAVGGGDALGRQPAEGRSRPRAGDAARGS